VRKLLLVAVVVGLLAVMAVSAQADGAVVIKDIGCRLLDGNGNIVEVDSSQAVTTPADGGKLTCKAEGVAPPPDGKARIFNYENTGGDCNTPVGPTPQWQNVVTPSGVSILSCRANPSER
jgi:hypothetical protein